MPKDQVPRLLLIVTIILIVFYPFKGLLNVPLYLLFGVDRSAAFMNPIVGYLALGFVCLSFLVNGRKSQFDPFDMKLFMVGIALMVLSLVRQNFAYTRVVFFVLVMPLLVSHLGYGSLSFLRRSLTIFWAAVAVYVGVEHLLLHSHLYGLTDGILIDGPAYLNYSNLLVWAESETLLDNVIDLRHVTPEPGVAYTMPLGRVRTGGFLGHALQMPTLISMAAAFFYFRFRRSPSIPGGLLLALAVFNVSVSLSTTAVMAFLLSVMFYEAYYASGPARIAKVGALILVTVVLITVTYPFAYLYNRFLLNWEEGAHEFGFYNPFKVTDVIAIAVGKQGWLPEWNNLYSENDLLNLVTALGIVLAACVFYRWLRPVMQAKRLRNDDLFVYSMVVLNAVLCMAHREATMSLNVFPLMALMNAISYRLIRERQPKAVFAGERVRLSMAPA